MHFLKEGRKNSGMGRPPPPLIRAMPERKRFFSIDPFPYTGVFQSHETNVRVREGVDDLVGDVTFQNFQSNYPILEKLAVS